MLNSNGTASLHPCNHFKEEELNETNLNICIAGNFKKFMNFAVA